MGNKLVNKCCTVQDVNDDYRQNQNTSTTLRPYFLTEDKPGYSSLHPEISVLQMVAEHEHQVVRLKKELTMAVGHINYMQAELDGLYAQLFPESFGYGEEFMTSESDYTGGETHSTATSSDRGFGDMLPDDKPMTRKALSPIESVSPSPPPASHIPPPYNNKEPNMELRNQHGSGIFPINSRKRSGSSNVSNRSQRSARRLNKFKIYKEGPRDIGRITSWKPLAKYVPAQKRDVSNKRENEGISIHRRNKKSARKEKRFPREYGNPKFDVHKAGPREIGRESALFLLSIGFTGFGSKRVETIQKRSWDGIC